MEKYSKVQQEKLVISFSGCKKKDKVDKRDGGSSAVRGIRRLGQHATCDSKNISSQLSYKF